MGPESKDGEHSLRELYALWNDSQSYLAEQIAELDKRLDKTNENLSKLVKLLKETKEEVDNGRKSTDNNSS